jgi:hypothetical protein
VPLIDEIEMRIELHDMHRPLVREGGDAGRMHRMVAAERDRQRARRQDFAYREFGIRETSGRIGVNDVGITDIDDAHLLRRQIDHVVLVVIGAAMSEREERRGVSDRAWPEARPGAILRTHVVRDAQHRDVGIDLVPIETDRPFGKGGMPDEREVQSPGLVGMLCWFRRLVHAITSRLSKGENSREAR